MKPTLAVLLAAAALPALRAAVPAAPSYPRPLVELNTGYFPFHDIGPITAESWAARKRDIRDRILLASGLYPLPTRTPLNAIIHGRVERDDYTVDRVIFESFPGHYVTGNLYRPKNPPKDRKMPGILSPHGHWPNGRFTDNGAGSKATLQQLAIGAERWESGARMPLHARCVQLARMGCAVFFYDMLGYADSVQIAEHRSGRRPELEGRQPGTFGLFSPMADLRLQSSFGLQTWNGLRALDFLLSLPEVDPARIGVTGESGGGTQTMVLAATDDRIAAAFPCVMVSTAMQGGCTCENANYLRIGQGNIDLAAAFAPKPMGMTAANDWTKELETKGFPDLKRVWQSLGRPDDVMATFNLHWGHNYNHVSRTTMYGFMNKHFKLGYSEPVLEREFVVPTQAEMTVWTEAHPKPSGNQVGGAHEKALLKHWSEDSDRQLAQQPEALARAWEIIIGRKAPAAGDLRTEQASREERATFTLVRATVRDTRFNEEIPYVLLEPKTGNGTTALWLADRGPAAVLGGDGQPTPAAQQLLAAGIAVACPTLYLPGATEQPMNPVNSKDTTRREWRWAACYTFGYNHSLLAHRVHDTVALATALQTSATRPARLLLVGTEGAGVVGAAAAGVLKGSLAGAVLDTESFRFAALEDIRHPLFVPGAVKYGDVPALLRLAQSLRPVVLGEAGAPGGSASAAEAAVKLAAATPDRPKRG